MWYYFASCRSLHFMLVQVFVLHHIAAISNSSLHKFHWYKQVYTIVSCHWVQRRLSKYLQQGKSQESKGGRTPAPAFVRLLTGNTTLQGDPGGTVPTCTGNSNSLLAKPFSFFFYYYYFLQTKLINQITQDAHYAKLN